MKRCRCFNENDEIRARGRRSNVNYEVVESNVPCHKICPMCFILTNIVAEVVGLSTEFFFQTRITVTDVPWTADMTRVNVFIG